MCFPFTNPSNSNFSAVIWGHVSEEVAHTAKEDLVAIKDELRNNQTKRWQAVGTLKHVLSFVNLPWELKKHAIDFLLCITDGGVSGNYNEEHSEWSSCMPSLFSALQVVFTVICDFCLSLLNLLLSQRRIKNADIYFSYVYTLNFQAVKMVIMYAPEPELRKKSFAVLKGVSF